MSIRQYVIFCLYILGFCSAIVMIQVFGVVPLYKHSIDNDKSNDQDRITAIHFVVAMEFVSALLIVMMVVCCTLFLSICVDDCRNANDDQQPIVASYLHA